jgi:N-methylhydantoinase A
MSEGGAGASDGLRIGADVGGTFTDVIALDSQGGVRIHKVPSSPPDYERAVLKGIEELVGCGNGTGGPSVAEVAHGTTVATNAVLEHRGARTALVTTRGFRDVFELRRLRAPQLFNLFFEKPKTLVERYLRLEVTERVSATGEILKPLEEAELQAVKERLLQEEVESVAVCLLHSYAYPEHELKVGEFLRRELPEIEVSLSCEVLRERKEYERTATTVVNSYVLPLIRRYLDALRRGLGKMAIVAPLQIMQSAGGLTPDEDAARRPVFILESGPAAGVLAARYMARRLEIRNAITFDMGGTTAKASLIEGGSISYSSEYEVGSTLSSTSRLVGGAGELIRVPTIDIAEVGAGGGSIAYLDSAGSLHVGPRSAGADPGPVCYQKGGREPTLTDANVVLGYIRPGKLANGDVQIDREAAARAIQEEIAAPLGLRLLEAAFGIHRIANAATMRALREVSTQRGRDPREYALIAFGGSGPIQAAGLGRQLRVPRIVVPPLPGLFSAAGLLFSDVEHHDVRSCLLSGESLSVEALRGYRDEMQGDMLARFEREGYPAGRVIFECHLDMRYKGQYSDLRIPLGRDLGENGTIEAVTQAFEQEHSLLYGHTSEDLTEVVAVRLIGRIPPELSAASLTPAGIAVTEGSRRRAYYGDPWGLLDTPVLSRAGLGKGVVPGPLLVDEYDSTIVVPPDMRARLDTQNNLIMEPIDAWD